MLDPDPVQLMNPERETALLLDTFGRKVKSEARLVWDGWLAFKYQEKREMLKKLCCTPTSASLLLRNICQNILVLVLLLLV